jgi:uncharacterized damage-inducible protein DinB
MEPLDTLTTLFSHNLWANLLLIERCAQLTNEQLDSSITGTYGSIRDTLQHIVNAEQSYFSRISTGQPHRRPKDAPTMTIMEMWESAAMSGNGFVEWAAKVHPHESVLVDWDGTPREVPKSIILTQAINHATEHRAQVMATMTQLGVQPPELDSWSYFDQLDI